MSAGGPQKGEQGLDHEDETVDRFVPSMVPRVIAVLLLFVLCAVFMCLVMWFESGHQARMLVYDTALEVVKNNLSFYSNRGKCRREIMEADPLKQYRNCNLTMGSDYSCTECPQGWEKIRGGWGMDYCYKFNETKMDWQGARRTCLDQGADLAVDMRYANNRVDINKMVSGKVGEEEKVWIGLNNFVRRDVFRWVNNVRLHKGKDEWENDTVKHWDWSLGNYTNEKDEEILYYKICGALVKVTDEDGKPITEGWKIKKNWRKRLCNNTYSFICEKRPLDTTGESCD